MQARLTSDVAEMVGHYRRCYTDTKISIQSRTRPKVSASQCRSSSSSASAVRASTGSSSYHAPSLGGDSYSGVTKEGTGQISRPNRRWEHKSHGRQHERKRKNGELPEPRLSKSEFGPKRRVHLLMRSRYILPRIRLLRGWLQTEQHRKASQ
jgi:hypothetical protein